jgi:hypothetical protein
VEVVGIGAEAGVAVLVAATSPPIVMVVAPGTWCGSGRKVRAVAARVPTRVVSARRLLLRRRLGKAPGRTRRWLSREAALGRRLNNSCSSAQGKLLSLVMLHVSNVGVRHILLLVILQSDVKGVVN